jgi:hypothetical protein
LPAVCDLNPIRSRILSGEKEHEIRSEKLGDRGKERGRKGGSELEGYPCKSTGVISTLQPFPSRLKK